MAVCNVHGEYLDGLELQSVVNEFVHTNERRLQLFGQSFDYVISKNSQSLSLTIISHLII